MAKITLRPTSASGNNWNNIGNAYDGNESTNASVSVSLFSSPRTLTLNFDTSVIPSGATINSATLTLRSKAGKTSITAHVDINGNSEYRVINQKQSTSATNYTADVTSYISDLTSVEVAVINNNWSGNTFDLYELWIDVDYTASTTYTVRFLDWDNSVISTQTVTRGGSATPPSYPTRNGYINIGWNRDYTNVTGNIDIVAQYVVDANPATPNYMPLASTWPQTTNDATIIQRKDYSISGIFANGATTYLYYPAEWIGKEVTFSIEGISDSTILCGWDDTDSSFIFMLNKDTKTANVTVPTTVASHTITIGLVYQGSDTNTVWVTGMRAYYVSDSSGGEVDTSVKNIKIGNSTIDKLYLGTTQILKAYLGSILLYSYFTGGTGGGDTPVIGDSYHFYTGYPLIVENSSLDANYGSYITEIVGNTTQSSTDLTDIRSVGVLQGDGTYKVDIIASNQNGTQTQTKSIYLPQPLCTGAFKAGNGTKNYVRDRIFYENEKWYLDKYVLKVKIKDFTWGSPMSTGVTGYNRMVGKFYTGCDTTLDYAYSSLNFKLMGYIQSYSLDTQCKEPYWDANCYKFEVENYNGQAVIKSEVSFNSSEITSTDDFIAQKGELDVYVLNPVNLDLSGNVQDYSYTITPYETVAINDNLYINTYANYTKVITDEKEVAPISMSGNFASLNLWDGVSYLPGRVDDNPTWGDYTGQYTDNWSLIDPYGIQFDITNSSMRGFTLQFENLTSGKYLNFTGKSNQPRYNYPEINYYFFDSSKNYLSKARTGISSDGVNEEVILTNGQMIASVLIPDNATCCEMTFKLSINTPTPYHIEITNINVIEDDSSLY